MNKKLLLNDKILAFSEDVCNFFGVPYHIQDGYLYRDTIRREAYSDKSSKRKYFRYVNTLLYRLNSEQEKVNLLSFDHKKIPSLIKSLEKSYNEFQDIKENLVFENQTKYRFNSNDFY